MMSNQILMSLLWEWLMPVKCLAYLRSANVCTIWLIDITTNSSITSDQSWFRSNMRVGNGSVGFVQTLDASGRVRPWVPIFSSNLSIIIDAIFTSMQVLLDRGYLLIKLVNHGCCKLVPMSASLYISESRRTCKRKSGKGMHGNIAGFSVGRKHQRKKGKKRWKVAKACLATLVSSQVERSMSAKTQQSADHMRNINTGEVQVIWWPMANTLEGPRPNM